ncbi:MAG: glycogen debranching protein GlgX [Planctomycetales bacterium]|nr:glycogen debranching protein GlgX [Planctomycetales bacterium]
MGATCTDAGVNFCVYAKHANMIELLLFDRAEDKRPSQVIRLDPDTHRTYDYWHVEVSGAGAGQLYGYRAAGPDERQLRYDPEKLLVDPYALAVTNTENYDRAQAAAPGDNAATAMKSVVVDPAAYDWEGDRPLDRPFIDSVIYELHVRGFTMNANSGVAAAKRGTYAGLIEKIPYLVDLGIKTVELMPVQQFDALAAPGGVNYWGYQPVAWFAPHRQYSSQADVLAPVNEFRDLVKALHHADIEVVLDVVFNHTAEGNAAGPTLSLRGLDNPTYYLLDPSSSAGYVDDTGCGNTVSGNNPIVRRMILDCLRHWVEHMHVDGFRFDLAASLSRGEDGQPLRHPPILLDIEADPLLAGTKIIAEAWDAAGLYQLANFGGDRWSVWNGQFRDHARRFVKSDLGAAAALADNISGSAELLGCDHCLPSRSVNFVTAHDGFTLNDLVTYNEKHNEANGEENRDGSNDNFSWNCGVEGPSDDDEVEALRRRQLRNFFTILLLAQGRPMIAMGDEVRRTQRGNNNAYALDDETSWFNWDDVRRHADLRRFVRKMLRFHQEAIIFRDPTYWGAPGATSITWHGVQLENPDWGDDSHTLAYELRHRPSGEHLHVMLNAFWKPLDFALPATADGRRWHRLVDTSLAAPEDFPETAAPIDGQLSRYTCQPRCSVVLVSLE